MESRIAHQHVDKLDDEFEISTVKEWIMSGDRRKSEIVCLLSCLNKCLSMLHVAP
jgi:hypothetical protein